MKKQIIFIGAFVAVSVTASFLYTQAVPETSSVPTPIIGHATFNVGDRTYSATVAPNETVMSAMRTLAMTDDFTYTSKEYSGLGVFVDSINGKKNGNGMYWILYVNDALSNSGAGATVLSAGDVVEWKYEKGY